MDWFKAYQDGILRGSLATTSHTTQLIWLKLLAVHNETRLRDGWLHYKPGTPIPKEYLATVCNVTTEEFEAALAEFLKDFDQDGHARIEIADDGDIFIKNWEKYQASKQATGKRLAGLEEDVKDIKKAQSDELVHKAISGGRDFTIGSKRGKGGK